jgi:uncharacterized protein YjbI with pentapeptide repeats
VEAFDPPKYITSLIAAVNDGAKAAQAGAFLFLLVGLYLLASAFSASDEDLLLGKTVTISQIGTSLPVSFSFAIAPMVFVFLHIYTLVRYDLLANNVRQFRKELRDTVPLEADRERCRQLLANVEFVVVLATPRSSATYSRIWRWLFRGIVAAFPLGVLLLVQINALRYQRDPIIWVQRTWLAIDLAALVWFFHRNPLNGTVWSERPALRWAGLLSAPIVIGAVNLLWLGTVPPDAKAELVRYAPRNTDNSRADALGHVQSLVEDPMHVTITWFGNAVSEPLDVILCPRLKWGCRFLRVDHQILVNLVRDEKTLADLRTPIAKLKEVPAGEVMRGDPEQKAIVEHAKTLASVEGVFLRSRSLRFAALDESRLYAADLIEADLGQASLQYSQLQDANLSMANLSRADLTGADLSRAQIYGTNLVRADLINADLSDASLSGADLAGANLKGVNLSRTCLANADLSKADLINANLSDANLLNTDLSDAKLGGQAQLDAACGKPRVLPKDLHLEKACPSRAHQCPL